MPGEALKGLFRRYVGIRQSGEIATLPEATAPGHVGHPAQGDRVASRMIAEASPATDGQRARLHGLNISRIADGKNAGE